MSQKINARIACIACDMKTLRPGGLVCCRISGRPILGSVVHVDEHQDCAFYVWMKKIASELISEAREARMRSVA